MKDFNIKKLYYSISEVSKITEVEQYVLRFWETEFEQLKPQKNRAGNRIYTNKDIELILFIKSLLREQKYTIEGAKQVLSDYSKNKNIDHEALKNSEPQLFESEDGGNDESGEINIEKDLQQIKSFLKSLLQKL